MLSFFNRKASSPLIPELPSLDQALYPLKWGHQKVESAEQLLIYTMQTQLNIIATDNIATRKEQCSSTELTDQRKQFSQLLLQNDVYQDWVNFTVFGRYIQRSFSAFYQQTEDVFNADMPDLLKHELMRHTQYLPKGQMLLAGGQLSNTMRKDKLLIATLNPFQAINESIKYNSRSHGKLQASTLQSNLQSTPALILNVITVNSKKVKAFAVKHNKRTSDGARNEVMILDFQHLTLLQEEEHKNNAQPELTFLIRHYSIS